MDPLNQLSHYSAHHLLDHFNGSWILVALLLLFVGMFVMSSGRDLYNFCVRRHARHTRRDQANARLNSVLGINKSTQDIH